MGFKKGQPGGPGRPKGVPNRSTTLIKTAVMGALQAFEKDGKKGAQAYMEFLALEEPRAFAQLIGRILPSELKVSGTLEREIVLKVDYAGDTPGGIVTAPTEPEQPAIEAEVLERDASDART